MKKFIALLLSLVMVASLAACSGNNGGGENPGGEGDNPNLTPTTPQYTVTEREEHLVDESKRLHKVTVTDSDRPFIVDGETDYKIISGGTDWGIKAANFVAAHIAAATGAEIEVIDSSETSPDPWTAQAKYIVMGDDEMFGQAGLRMPEENLVAAGYYIKTVGNSCFIAVQDEYGWQMGAIAFLKHVLGYEMFAANTVIYEKDGATLPDMEIIEKPDISYRSVSDLNNDTATTYGMGIQERNDQFIQDSQITWVHNAVDYFPTSAAEDPRYDADMFGGGNICYLGHGKPEVRQNMVEIVAEKMINMSNAQPELGVISLTQEDGVSGCTCAACQESISKYGTSSAMQVQFLNDVDTLVRNGIPGRGVEGIPADRNLTLLFFAYTFAQVPPATKQADGTWKPVDDTCIAHPDVAVFYAPIFASWNHSFYEEENESSYADILGWNACCEKLFIWMYETNFSYYLYPYNSFESMIETYRLFKDHGASFIFDNAQGGNSSSQPAFSLLKTYIFSQATVDVNLSYDYLIDRFFTHYFGEAKEPMLRYFNTLKMWLEYIQVEYGGIYNGNVYAPIEDIRIWPKGMLESWVDDVNEAYEAIDGLRATDPDRYELLYRHITIESIFPRYALIRLYSAYYNNEELQQMRQSFHDDAVKYGVHESSEGGSLDSVYSSWGIS